MRCDPSEVVEDSRLAACESERLRVRPVACAAVNMMLAGSDAAAKAELAHSCRANPVPPIDPQLRSPTLITQSESRTPYRANFTWYYREGGMC